MLAASACSLFVGLDGLQDGGDASVFDAGSLGDGASDGAGDGASDAAVDAPPCLPAARVQFAYTLDDDAGPNGDGGGTDNVSVALAGLEEANDFVVVGVNYLDCVAITSVTDTAGNTYKSLIPAAGNVVGTGILETWGAANVVRASNNTVTVQFAAACVGRDLKVVEYSGVDPLSPIESTVSMFGGPNVAPDAGLTTSAGAILFAHTADSASCLGPGNGWTQIVLDRWATLAEERFATSGGAFIASEQPSSNDVWVIEAVALRTCKSP